MAIIVMPPSLTWQSVDNMQLTRASNVIRSRYTGQRNAIVYPYAVWTFEATPVEVNSNTVLGGALRSFLVQLDGVANSFRLPVPDYKRSLTGYAANATTTGSDAPANQQFLQLSGFPASTPIFNDGDYITVNDELKVIVGNYASNSNGLLTVNFKPGLRKVCVSGTPVILQNPTVLLCAQDDDIANWNVKPPYRQNSKLKFIESMDATV